MVVMLIRKAFKYRIDTTVEMEQLLFQYAGNCRFLWNNALALNMHYLENPGRMVRQKSGLNRAILDQGWGMFKTVLEYKQQWLGGQVLSVDPKGTSQTCSDCHHVSKDNRKTLERLACLVCGHVEHADVVGAKNSLERGHRLLAPQKQIPADSE
jgi:putative transposase